MYGQGLGLLSYFSLAYAMNVIQTAVQFALGDSRIARTSNQSVAPAENLGYVVSFNAGL